MKFEVIEQAGTWIVQHQGEEVARFDERVSALAEVARRLRDADLGERRGVAFNALSGPRRLGTGSAVKEFVHRSVR
ncbi:hypothetical protein [Phenylobacterium sp. J367]|uniref:hypothetical protein n=1 Tax=Phenylobacterium sp. J367 TaxID=2898435 RepID=UPI002150CDC5|nr:hypothetical protein [Phenylobacterium sp. J367]MCR5878941.1 hypothetical protein [Phenylobacterium sp. J367]